MNNTIAINVGYHNLQDFVALMINKCNDCKDTKEILLNKMSDLVNDMQNIKTERKEFTSFLKYQDKDIFTWRVQFSCTNKPIIEFQDNNNFLYRLAMIDALHAGSLLEIIRQSQ